MLVKIKDDDNVQYVEANKIEIIGDVDNEGDAATQVQIDNVTLRQKDHPIDVTVFGPNFERTWRVFTGPTRKART
jgi:hypothetical protein